MSDSEDDLVVDYSVIGTELVIQDDICHDGCPHEREAQEWKAKYLQLEAAVNHLRQRLKQDFGGITLTTSIETIFVADNFVDFF